MILKLNNENDCKFIFIKGSNTFLFYLLKKIKNHISKMEVII